MQLNGVFQQQFFRTNQLELLQLQPMVGKGHQELQLINEDCNDEIYRRDNTTYSRH